MGNSIVSPVSNLRELQRWMKTRIQPDALAAGARVTAPRLNPQGGEPGEARLAVYAEGYQVRLREALAEAYEAIHHILGGDAFGALAREYARRYPSHDYNLSFAGRHLPDYLPQSSWAERLPFLPDLARLEWAVCQAFHAFEQPPIDPAQYASWSLEDWQRACVSLQPSVGVVVSNWPILDLWAARTAPREAIDIQLESRPQSVVVFRQDVRVRAECVTPLQAALIDGLRQGRTLGDVCADVAPRAPGQELPLADWFRMLTERALVVGCTRA